MTHSQPISGCIPEIVPGSDGQSGKNRITSGLRPYDPMTRSASNAVFVVSMPGCRLNVRVSNSELLCLSAALIACSRLLLQR